MCKLDFDNTVLLERESYQASQAMQALSQHSQKL